MTAERRTAIRCTRERRRVTCAPSSSAVPAATPTRGTTSPHTSAALAGIVAGAGYRVEVSDDLLGGLAALGDADLLVVNAGNPEAPLPEGAGEPPEPTEDRDRRGGRRARGRARSRHRRPRGARVGVHAARAARLRPRPRRALDRGLLVASGDRGRARAHRRHPRDRRRPLRLHRDRRAVLRPAHSTA